MKKLPFKNTKTVFISRDLQQDSLFFKQLKAADYQIDSGSLLQFEAIPFKHYPVTDWIFFYSRKAVNFFLNQIENLSPDIKIAAYGTGTAAALAAKDKPIHFTGTGAGETTTPLFLKIAKNKTVLFPQARHSRRTVEQLAGEKIESYPLIVYDNKIRKDVKKQKAGILVFTSPLNATAYFQQFKLENDQRVVVIGKATAGAVEKFGIGEIVIAEQPSEAGLAASILKISPP